MNWSTCRLCKKNGIDKHPYPMVKYGVRHSVHADCGLAKWGAQFFDRLTPWQLTQFPVFAAIDAGLMESLRAAAAARPYCSTYKSPLKEAE